MALKRTENKNRYNEKTYEAMNARVKKDGSDGITVDQVREVAAKEGKSLNALILEAVKEKVRRIEEQNASGHRPPVGKEEIER